MSDMPEINLKIETKEVKGGVKKQLTVRNTFYIGFIGKIKTMWYWVITHRKKFKTFKEYLDSPVTYVIDYNTDIHAYHSIDAEAELSKILLEEIDNAMMEQLNVDKQGLEDLKIQEFNQAKKWLSENANLTDEQQEKLCNAKYKNDDKH